MIGDAKLIKFEKNGRVALAAVIGVGAFVLLIETRNIESCRAAQVGSLRDWHERLGHIHVDMIWTMAPTEAVGSMHGDEENFFCESCVVAKQSRPAHLKSERKHNPEAGEFFHTQTCAVDSRCVH